MESTKKGYSLRHKLGYSFDKFMSQGSFSLIVWLGVLTTFIVLIFAVVLNTLGLRPVGERSFGFFDAFWVNITHVLDPGNVGGHEGSEWAFLMFMLFVTIVGIIIISTLIGLISNGILDKIEDMRKGRSFVIEDGHVLILGWSSKIFTIISELVIANENQKKPKIVILADIDKMKMEDEIRDKVGNLKNTKIICRNGNPIDLHDLQIANPGASKSIIILDTDAENSDSQIIKTILAIVSKRKNRNIPYHITAEIDDSQNYRVAKMVGKGEVELIPSDDFISKIMVQTSRQSGLSVVYIELMDFGGDEIYFYEEASMVGKTFLEVLFSYDDSAIIGIQYANGKVAVNPPMRTRIARGDKLIGITEDDDTIIPSKVKDFRALRIDQNAILKKAVTPEKKAEAILIVGWNQRARSVIIELDNYVVSESRIKVVSKFDDCSKDLAMLSKELKNIKTEFECVNTTSLSVLKSLECYKYDYIILLSYQSYYSMQEADAQTLITLLHLRDISELSPKKLKIVSEMMDMRNRQLADITRADDFIVSDKLLSLLMTQVAENKYLMRVFEDLFDADGSEIYIKPAKDYVKVNHVMNFYTVLEAAARRGEVAIGYRIIADARDSEKGYGVIVNPTKSELFSFAEEDKIILLAED